MLLTFPEVLSVNAGVEIEYGSSYPIYIPTLETNIQAVKNYDWG